MGSTYFKAYVSNLQRIKLAEFIDNQRIANQPGRFRASLVDNPLALWRLPDDREPRQNRRAAS